MQSSCQQLVHCKKLPEFIAKVSPSQEAKARQWKKRLLWLNIAKISFGIMHIALNPRCKQYNKGIEWSPRPYISLLCQGLRD